MSELRLIGGCLFQKMSQQREFEAVAHSDEWPESRHLRALDCVQFVRGIAAPSPPRHLVGEATAFKRKAIWITPVSAYLVV